MSEPQLAAPIDTPNFAPRLYGIAALVAVIVVAGAWLTAQFNASDLARDMQRWQEKLNLIAESRTTDVNSWVSGNFKELKTLSDNPSLQLYMSELQMMKGSTEALPPDSAEPSQKSYLRNLLLFTAQHAGFGSGANNPMGIPANVSTDNKNVLAILDNNNQILVSTPMSQETQDILLAHATQPMTSEQSLIDMDKDKDGTPYIGFAVAVYGIQGDHNPASQIGRVIGIKTVDDNLFTLLTHPGVIEKTLETILVRKNKNKVEYLSPLEDGTKALAKEDDFDSKKFVAAALMEEQGAFAYERKDYRNKVVLATSRTISGTPWTLIVKVDRQEALAQSNQRRASMEMFFFMIIAIIVLIIITLWRHAYSKRAMFMSGYFRTLAAHSLAQEKLLRIVADNQPEAIYLVDAKKTVHFANQKAASDTHMSLENIGGKTLEDVRGSARAEHMSAQCDKAIRQNETEYDVQRTQHDVEEKIIRSAYVPITHLPISSLPEPTVGVLIVEQDISEIVHEREQQLETQRELVNTMIKLVDRRDPFAANHSQLVAQVAHEVAAGMELDRVTVDTTATAGNLMNIGKIVVPTELLTKTDSLTTEEKHTIRESMHAAADMIKNIHFDGPVVETLRQWQEKWDGSGPMSLKGEDILISARIIAVANAFIGMISPRSWRTAIPIESANKFLLDQAGSYFDRRVVVALINYVENHQGRAWLKGVMEGHKDVA